MGLVTSNFMKAQFQHRTAEVDVLPLAMFFDNLTQAQKEWVELPPTARLKLLKDGGEAQVIPWSVRGQSASEVCKSLEAVNTYAKINSIAEAISTNNDQKESIKTALGLGTDTPKDIIKRLEQLVTCSIDPVIDLPVAVKLAETFPIEFYLLTNKIIELTGLGMDLKKL